MNLHKLAVLFPFFLTAVSSAAFTGGCASESTAASSEEEMTKGTQRPHNTWQAVANLPTPRSGLAAVTTPDGRIFAMGGQYFDDAGNEHQLATVEVYTPSTNTWETAASMPTAREGFVAALAPDGRIFAIGGHVGSYPKYDVVSTVEAYTPSTDTWETVTSMPTARGSLGMAVASDGRFFVLGGLVLKIPEKGDSGFEPVSTVEVYTPSTDTWETVASMTTPRPHLGAAVAPDGRILAIGGLGGFDADESHPLSTVEAYTPTTNTWEPVASLLGARGSHEATSAPDGRIFAIGGTRYAGGGPLSPGQALLATAEAYTVTKDSWENVASMPTARRSLAVTVASDGRIFAIGGADGGDGALATVEAYTP